MIDFSDDSGAVNYRERIERARREARRRYRDHLAGVFARHDVADPDELADSRWMRYRVAIHRQRRALQLFVSPPAARQRAARLRIRLRLRPCARGTPPPFPAVARQHQSLLAITRGPTDQSRRAGRGSRASNVARRPAGDRRHRHDGPCPEQWTGEVDDHSFYFRERHAQWRIETDLRPSGRFIRTVTGTDNDGATSTRSARWTKATSSPTAQPISKPTAPRPSSGPSSSPTPSASP